MLVTAGGAATRAATRRTSTTPIVMVGVSDPVRGGLLARPEAPGGNITGVVFDLPASVMSRRLELLREVVPSTARVGALVTGDALGASVAALRQTAAQLGIGLEVLPITTPAEVEPALQAAQRAAVDALVIEDGPATFAERRRVLAFARQHRLVTMHGLRVWLDGGGTLAYGPHRLDLAVQAATFVDRILRGTAPGTLALAGPRELELAVNVDAAPLLGVPLRQDPTLRPGEIVTLVRSRQGDLPRAVADRSTVILAENSLAVVEQLQLQQDPVTGSRWIQATGRGAGGTPALPLRCGSIRRTVPRTVLFPPPGPEQALFRLDPDVVAQLLTGPHCQLEWAGTSIDVPAEMLKFAWTSGPRPSEAPSPSRPPGAGGPVTIGAQVLAVLDGTTVRIRVAGRQEDLRYLGLLVPSVLNASEKHLTAAWDALAANRSLVEGKSIQLTFDEVERDREGRLLAYVEADGRSVNAELLRRGLAQPAPFPPHREASRFLTVARQAAPVVSRGQWLPGGQPPDDGGLCPVTHPVKASLAAPAGVRCLYVSPGGLAYGRMTPYRCYATAEEAEAAGCRGVGLR